MSKILFDKLSNAIRFAAIAFEKAACRVVETNCTSLAVPQAAKLVRFGVSPLQM